MRKIITILLILCFVSPASAKILGLVGSGAECWEDDVIDVWRQFERSCEVLGIDVEYLSADDSLNVWNAMNSGDYSKAVMVNLPSSLWDYNTEAECNALGLGELVHWIDGDDPLAAPCKLILASNGQFPYTAAWPDTITGIVGRISGQGTDMIPIVNASGDSVYVHSHNSIATYHRVAANDSISWVHNLIWSDSTTTLLGDVNQKISLAWYTDDSDVDGHRVYYLPDADYSYVIPSFLSILAIGEDVTPVKIPWIIGDLGRLGSHGDTTRAFTERFNELKDSLVNYDAKATIVIETKSFYDDNADSVGVTAYPNIIDTILAYPDNMKLIHGTGSAWDAAGSYWLGYNTTVSQSDVEGHIESSVDSTALEAYLGSDISPNTIMAYDGAVAGQYQEADWQDILLALAEQDIGTVYIKGSDSNNLPPTSYAYCIMEAQRWWVQKSDETYNQIDFLPYSKDWGTTTYYGSVTTAQQSVSAEKLALFNVHWLKIIIGTEVSSARVMIDKGNYQPGLFHQIGLLCGVGFANDLNTNTLLTILNSIEQQRRMCNDLAGQELIQYAWMEDTIHDRKLKRKYCNSHVKRN